MKSIYKNIVSRNIRCRVPEHFAVGEGSIVDDYCYFSTRIKIGRFCHVANNVSIAGGRKYTFSWATTVLYLQVSGSGAVAMISHTTCQCLRQKASKHQVAL